MKAKIEQFCRQYVVDFNGSAAAVRAGYSAKNANVTSSKLLAKPNVREYINKLQLEMSEATGITAKRVLEELAKIGFANIQDFVNGGNDIENLADLDSEKTAAVSSIKKTVRAVKEGTETTVHITLHSKVAALEKLGQHLGVFATKQEVVPTEFTITLTDD